MSAGDRRTPPTFTHEELRVLFDAVAEHFENGEGDPEPGCLSAMDKLDEYFAAAAEV